MRISDWSSDVCSSDLFLFLRDGWSTFVVALSLPISIITTFFFMGQFGLSLNVMSLGGLALATGLVVDDSIVVLESIAKARERGLGIIEAAFEGTREVSMAVVASDRKGTRLNSSH